MIDSTMRFSKITRIVIASTVLVALLGNLTARAQEIPAAGKVFAVRLEQELRSGREHIGDKVRFTVVEDMRSEDGQHVLLPKGAAAMGYILRSQGRRNFGRAGILIFTCENVTLPSGEKLALQLADGKQGFQEGKSEEARLSNMIRTTALVSGIGLILAIGSSQGLGLGLLSYFVGVVGIVNTAITSLFTRGRDAIVPRGTLFPVQVKKF